MEVARTRSVSLRGLEGALVEVEAHIAPGLPSFALTGLPDKACGQAPDRVRPALASSGYPLPTRRITVNLSPAALEKHGSGFDLPIAVAVLVASGVIAQRVVGDIVHLGELGLDGALRRIHGILPAVLHAQAQGVRTVIVPPENLAEAQLVEGVDVHAPPNLRTLIQWYAGVAAGHDLPQSEAAAGAGRAERLVGDLADVVGQTEARMALELAATGGHHLALGGPPGVGKTMLAERLVTILPPLTREQALQTHAVASLIGAIGAVHGLDLTPPYVAPHHTASMAALVGGGSRQVLPGAVSRAHHGVLFLDEAAEFDQRTLNTLRQPLESGEVVIARARAVHRYPARFLLVLASNPCPCGNAYHKGRECTCSPTVIRHYRNKLNGPLLDRIDLQVSVHPVTLSALDGNVGESSAVVAARVAQGRGAAEERWAALGYRLNAEVPGSVIRRPPYRLAARTTAGLARLLDRGDLTMRGFDRALRVAWTVADLAGHTVPDPDDVSAALALRHTGRLAA